MEFPTRTCIACRRPAAKATLTRLAAVDATVQVDLAARLPGRGAYLCRRQECAEIALRRGGAAVARALRIDRSRVHMEALAAALKAIAPGTDEDDSARTDSGATP